MDSNREGFHQAPNQPPGQSQQSTAPNGPPVLPPPQQASFFSNPPAAHNLPSIAGLTQQPQSSGPHATPAADMSSQHAHQGPPQPPSHREGGFAAINHRINQRDQERDRAREAEDMARREAEQREREMRDRQYQEQQRHEPQVIHQPVAVPPNVHGIHGPNGLLGNPNAAATTSAGQPPVPAPQPMYPGQPLVPDANARNQQGPPVPPQPSLLPLLGPVAQQAGGGMNQAQQPILNDALSYLDQVKVQFADHPDVYNRFLDIMKDFKSGAIDTPGVIERVSQLFAGNPGLIQGFNTFLPPGYKIECGTGDDPNSIRVTTPMGTTVSTMPAPRPLSPPRAPGPNGAMAGNERALFGPGWQHQQQEARFSPDSRQILAQPAFGGQNAPTSHPAHSPETYRQQQAEAIHRVEQQNVAQLQNAATAASRGNLMSSPGDGPLAAQLNGVSPAAAMIVNGGMEKRGPVEFNHAISYVNKIKNRFAQQPDIYKQFLEILQTYQRESKPIQDVYAQVTRLFETAPDLLEDFKQFLPESAASNQNKGLARSGVEDAFPLSSTRNDPTYLAAASANNHMHQTPRPEQHRLPPMGNFAPTPTASRDNKRKRADRQGPASMTPIAPDVSNAGGRGALGQAANGSKRLKTGQAQKQTVVPDMSTVTPSLIPPPPPVPMPPNPATTSSGDDFALFDRLRKQIGNKSLWAEFLKLLGMYKNDLVDQAFLVFKAASFIGANHELFQTFKDFVKYTDSDVNITNEPQTINGRIQLSNCRGLGPSYRMLPKLETNKKCSGRDELCNSVLNDNWVSHPTWASEDSGFVAHRKNVHEEGLHRVEEERHDYDSYIEACRRTIQLLEPIAQALAGATAEQRQTFQLDPKLGGQSETIYRRVIYKIYGRDKGNEAIREMFRRPYDVIPTLLARMRTQCETWKGAQTQWEKVWRMQTETLFWKSLDHQGASSRVGDKRQFFPKQLVNEMQVRYQEEKRAIALNRAKDLRKHHFEFSCGDHQVLRDSANLLLVYADHNYSTEHPTIVKSIKEILTIFFQLEESDLGQDTFTSLTDQDVEMSDGGASPRQRPVKRSKGDLLRGVLDKNNRKRDHDDSESRSRHSTPDEALAEMTDGDATPAVQDAEHPSSSSDEKWFTHPVEDNFLNGQSLKPNEPYVRSSYHMYGNGHLYCFMRTFAMLVERLGDVKANEENVKEDVRRQKEFKPARDLGWLAKSPSDFFSNTNSDANYYGQMLDMFRQMVRGDVENSHIEETLRRYYLDKGWQLYSLDKMLNSLTKFGLAIFFPEAKDKTQEIYALFKKDRARGNEISHNDESAYRRAVDKLSKEGEVYRITYDSAEPHIYFDLLKNGDPTFESSALSRGEAWKVYISSLQGIGPTDGVDHENVKQPALKRNLRAVLGSADAPAQYPIDADLQVQERMQFRISAKTYMFEAEPGSNDFFHSRAGEKAVSKEDAEKEGERRGAKVEEGWRANAEWMKGVSKDEVDAAKQVFKEKFEEEVPTPSKRRS